MTNKFHEANELALMKHDQQLADTIGTKLETKLSNIKIEQKVIKEKVIHEVTKEPVYTQCVTTPDGVRLIEQAIDASGEHDGGVPTN